MIRKILQLIEKNRRFLVASHRNPDGDAIASTLALGNALREMGKEVTTYNADPVPLSLSFLPGTDSMRHELEEDQFFFDVGFILDSGDLSRAGEHLAKVCRTLVNIDHHRNSEIFCEVNFLDPGASATGTLIYRLLKSLPGYRFTAEVASCIYTAILADTGAFRFGNTDGESFRIASEMLETGIDPAEIASQFYENQEARGLRLLARALSSLKVSEDGRVASVVVTLEEMKQTATGPVHTDGFINYPRSIRGVDVALLFRQEGDRLFKVGFRSRKGIDVGRVAQELGGGGHTNASGASLEGTLEDVERIVLEHVREELASVK
ncbi:MAG: bifunctional oligoribonuclease/PAP phosphatase NrnA [Desulfuromonadaceae bacterium]|nr:bifunctional oligoribonuclease/PAP phosphatase NrnA [Desulfuromonadaceae bacterium]